MRRFLISTCIFTLAILASCAPAAGDSEENPWWQQQVDAIRALHDSQKLPQEWIDSPAIKTGGEFDVNEYLPTLDHLQMEPGMVLDYAYYADGMGGWPVIYARPAGQPSYETVDDLTAATGTEFGGLRTSYLDHIRTDGTPEGFFQLALLRVMGGQFYLYWHAGYNDEEVISSRARLDELIEELQSGNFGRPVTAQEARAARKLDLRPVIEIGDESVTVRMIVFTRWGGFYQQTFKLASEFPHVLLEESSENLVPYDSGIMF